MEGSFGGRGRGKKNHFGRQKFTAQTTSPLPAFLDAFAGRQLLARIIDSDHARTPSTMHSQRPLSYAPTPYSYTPNPALSATINLDEVSYSYSSFQW